jgi:hypothetical protein
MTIFIGTPVTLIHILTAAEGANFVRTDAADALMLQLLPLVDQYLLNATGHDWAADTAIHPTAKIAAGMLLVYWYDNPGAVGQAPETIISQLVQLEAEALKYRKYQFVGLNGAGSIYLRGAVEGDDVVKLIGIYGAFGEISADGQIRQTSASDLSDNLYVVVLKSPAEDVSA